MWDIKYNNEVVKRITTLLDKSEPADVYKIGAYYEIKIVEQEAHPGYNFIALLYHNKVIFAMKETIDGAWETESRDYPEALFEFCRLVDKKFS